MLKTDNTIYKQASKLRGIIKNNTQMGIIYGFTGFIELVLAAILIYNLYKEWDYSYKNFKEIKKRERRKDIGKVIVGLITFFILLIISIYFIFFYNPTPDEVSMGILINHLRERGVIQDNVYDVLKSYKPSRIGRKVV